MSFQALSMQRVNATQQDQEAAMKQEMLLEQVGWTLEALEKLMSAVSSGNERAMHAANVAVVAQCNFLNGQTSLASMRGDTKGLEIGLNRVDKHSTMLRSQVDQSAHEILDSYYGYMNSVLSGDDAAPLPSVSITTMSQERLEAAGNTFFTNMLDAQHDTDAKRKDMKRNSESLRRRQAEEYAMIGGSEIQPSRRYDTSKMTQFMKGEVTYYDGSQKDGGRHQFGDSHTDDVGSLLMGHDSDIVMGDSLSVQAGDIVRLHGRRERFRVEQVNGDDVILALEGSGGRIRVRMRDIHFE